MKRCIINSTAIKDGILYLTLEPKKASSTFDFTAGQYAAISFRGENERKSPVRCFSFVSSATDNGHIQFAIRLLGDFTLALAAKKVGDLIFLQGPFGEFCVDEKQDKYLVMIAGGIGITPCLSIIRTVVASQLSIPILLLYSNRTGHLIPFHDEINTLQRTSKFFRATFFVTDSTTIPLESKRMLSGRVAEQHINQVVKKAYTGSTYFLCGPKQFMDDTELMLVKNGVSEQQIITESFTQASKLTFSNVLNARSATYAFSAALLAIMIIGITALDISHYIPAHALAVSETKTPTSETNSSTNTAPTGFDTKGSSASTSTSATEPAAGPTNSTSSPESTSNYQSPTSSVS
jgi:ferredoxin-NADP reductase